MKKRTIFILIGVTIWLSILVFVAIVVHLDKNTGSGDSDFIPQDANLEDIDLTFDEVLSFDLMEYCEQLERYPVEKKVEPIEDAEEAVEVSKELWIERYGTVNGKPYNPISSDRVEVFYDSTNMCWMVQGTMPKKDPDGMHLLGAVPMSIIQSDGTVLAVWMV